MFVSCTSALVIFHNSKMYFFLKAHSPLGVLSSLSLDALFLLFHLNTVVFVFIIVFLMTINIFELNCCLL